MTTHISRNTTAASVPFSGEARGGLHPLCLSGIVAGNFPDEVKIPEHAANSRN